MGTLILNEDFEAINYRGNVNYGFQYITAETVIYDIPAAGITSTDAKTYGPFYGVDITNLILGEHLYVHYYSDFRAYFDNQLKEYHWLCVDYFDKGTCGKNSIDL